MRPTKDEIASLLARFDQSNWDEMDVRIGDFRLRVSNTALGPAAPAPAPAAAPAPSAVAKSIAPPVHAKPTTGGAKNVVPEGHTAVRAPGLGRFWRKPKPTEPPFIEIGASVKAGDVVCIVEVMKLFTQVKAPAAGKVISCPLQDGEMVEFDDVLFVIEPA